MRYLAGLALLGLAITHLAIWLRPFDPEVRTYDPRSSELLRRAEVDERGARRTAVAGAVAVALLLFASALGTMGRAGWAPELAVAGAALSVLLCILYFHPWLLLLAVVDLAVITVAL